MRRQVIWIVAALVLGVLGGAFASSADETAVVAQLTAADHEVDEGYFSLGEGTTVVAQPGSVLHRWLASHRGEKVRLLIEVTRDGNGRQPLLRPGTGRDSGEISRLRPQGGR